VTPGASPGRIARFERLYDANYKDIYAFVYRRVASRDSEVGDIVSEVFTTAWRRLDDVPDASEERPWLFGVARLCVQNHFRRGQGRLRLISRLISERHRAEIAETDADSRQMRLRSALVTLRPRDREVLALVYWDGLSHAEAASVLGCSVNAVALRVSKAKVRLQARLGESTSVAPRAPHTAASPATSKD
jgi:RNA polymerase sigma-70 factor (ECF subfamily)